MQTALLPGYGEPLVIQDAPVPDPGPGEVLVRIAATGLCHSDLDVMDGTIPLAPRFPWRLGHENAGVVAALGDGVTEFEAGEPVAIYGGWGCGGCAVCRDGDEQLCNRDLWCGYGHPGGYAEYLLVPAARHLVRIDGLDPVIAAPLTDAALTPYRAIKRALPRLVPGSLTLVIGAGGLGHYAIQLLAALSGTQIVVVELAEDRRRLAADLGASIVLNPTETDVAGAVSRLSQGRGAAFALDLVGTGATLQMACRALGPKGMAMLVGLKGGAFPFSYRALAAEAALTTGKWGNRRELEEVVSLARAGRLRGAVDRRPLSQVNEAVAQLRAGSVTGRLVLVPGAVPRSQ